MKIEFIDEMVEIDKKRHSICQEIGIFKVVDSVTYNYAGQLILVLKDLRKSIEAYFSPLKNQAYKSWQAIVAREKEELSKIAPAEEKLKNEMLRWTFEQNQIRIAEEAKIKERLQKQEEERRLTMAIELEKQGKKDLAEQIVNEEIVVPEVPVPDEVPKVEGISYREDIDFEIEDESLIPREFLMVNEKAIRAFVKATKGSQKIPGVRIFTKTILVRK